MRVGIPACFMNIVSGAKQFGGCDQELVGTLQPTVQEVVGAPWPVRSWDCLMLRWERFVTDPRPCGIGRRRPCEAHGRTKAYAARHIPCRVMQVGETHSFQLSNSTTPLRQWSPSLILQADPSMSPPSRPLHKRREQTESSAQFFPLFPGCNRVLSLFPGPPGPRWCGWSARSNCYPTRHRFCRAAHVLMVDAARFGPGEHVGERPESLWYRNLLSLPSQDVSWSRSRSAVVLLSLPFLLLPLRAAAF